MTNTNEKNKANMEVTKDNLKTLIGGTYDNDEIICSFQDTDYDIIVNYNHSRGAYEAYENFIDSESFLIYVNEENEITSIR